MKETTKHKIMIVLTDISEWMEKYWILCAFILLFASIIFTLISISAGMMDNPETYFNGSIIYLSALIIGAITVFSSFVIIRLTQIRERLPNGNR